MQLVTITMNRNRHGLNTFLFLTILAVLAPAASAHVLVTDGKIGAVMHVDPDDDPIAGQPSTFHFWFKDTDGKLSTQNCNGFFTVVDKGNQIMMQPLFVGSVGTDLVSNHQFTFPHLGVYTVRVWGTPNGTSSPAFQPFVLDYAVRVAREAPNQTPEQTSQPNAGNWLSDHFIHIIVGAVIVGLAIVWVFFGGRSKRKTKK